MAHIIDCAISMEIDSSQPGIQPSNDDSNERQRYSITSSFIGWTHTQNGSWLIWDDFNHLCAALFQGNIKHIVCIFGGLKYGRNTAQHTICLGTTGPQVTLEFKYSPQTEMRHTDDACIGVMTTEKWRHNEVRGPLAGLPGKSYHTLWCTCTAVFLLFPSLFYHFIVT